jgi:hypothetical protein
MRVERLHLGGAQPYEALWPSRGMNSLIPIEDGSGPCIAVRCNRHIPTITRSGMLSSMRDPAKTSPPLAVWR